MSNVKNAGQFKRIDNQKMNEIRGGRYAEVIIDGKPVVIWIPD